MKSAAELKQEQDYPNFPEFAEYGIPMDKISAALITTLQTVRTKAGIPIYPSPVTGGWVRLDDESSGSRHYAVNRLSDGGDIFAARGRCLELRDRLLEVPNIGAVGVYADTDGPDGKRWPMLHFDLRPGRLKLLWAREGDYYYLPQNRVNFWRVVNEIIRQEEEV